MEINPQNSGFVARTNKNHSSTIDLKKVLKQWVMMKARNNAIKLDEQKLYNQFNGSQHHLHTYFRHKYLVIQRKPVTNIAPKQNILNMTPSTVQKINKSQTILVSNIPIVSKIEPNTQMYPRFLVQYSTLTQLHLSQLLCSMSNSPKGAELIIAYQVNRNSSIKNGFTYIIDQDLKKLSAKIQRGLNLLKCKAFQTKNQKIANADYIKIGVEVVPIYDSYEKWVNGGDVHQCAIRVTVKLNPVLYRKFKNIRPMFYICHPAKKINVAPELQFCYYQIRQSDHVAVPIQLPASQAYKLLLRISQTNKRYKILQTEDTYYNDPQQISINKKSLPALAQPQPPVFTFNPQNFYSSTLDSLCLIDTQYHVPLINKNQKIVQIQVKQDYASQVFSIIDKFLKQNKVIGKVLFLVKDFQEQYVKFRKYHGYIGYYLFYLVFQGNYNEVVQDGLMYSFKKKHKSQIIVKQIYNQITVGSQMTQSQLDTLSTLLQDKFCSYPKIMKLQDDTIMNPVTQIVQKNYKNIQIKFAEFDRHALMFAYFVLQITDRRPQSQHQKEKEIKVKKYQFSGKSVQFFGECLKIMKNQNLWEVFPKIQQGQHTFQVKISHSTNKEKVKQQILSYLNSRNLSYRIVYPLKQFQQAVIKARKKESGNPEAYHFFYLIFKYAGMASELEDNHLSKLTTAQVLVNYVSDVIVLPWLAYDNIKALQEFNYDVYGDGAKPYYVQIQGSKKTKDVRFQYKDMRLAICNYLVLDEARLRPRCSHLDKLQ